MTIYDLGHNGNARHGDVQLLQEDEGQLRPLPKRDENIRIYGLSSGMPLNRSPENIVFFE